MILEIVILRSFHSISAARCRKFQFVHSDGAFFVGHVDRLHRDYGYRCVNYSVINEIDPISDADSTRLR